MERVKLKRRMRIGQIGGVTLMAVALIFVLSFAIRDAFEELGANFPILITLVAIAMCFIGFAAYNDWKLKKLTRLVRFYCPKCEEYHNSPKDLPECAKCGIMMRPVRFCPRCRKWADVFEEQWTCEACGMKLEEDLSWLGIGH